MFESTSLNKQAWLKEVVRGKAFQSIGLSKQEMIEGNGEGQGALKKWGRWRMHNEACGVNMAKHGVLVQL